MGLGIEEATVKLVTDPEYLRLAKGLLVITLTLLLTVLCWGGWFSRGRERRRRKLLELELAEARESR